MKEKHKNVYMECARSFAKLSYAIRKKVGAVVVTPEDVMLYSWNGTAAGDDNCCEEKCYDLRKLEWRSDILYEEPQKTKDGYMNPRIPYVLNTKPTVLHAERNIIAKAAKEGISLKGATLFITMSCCLECALMIYQSGISKVVYDEQYRDLSGINYLIEHGVKVEQYGIYEN